MRHKARQHFAVTDPKDPKENDKDELTEDEEEYEEDKEV